jgi:hypothetical protein
LSLKQNDIQYAQLKVVIIRTNNKDETPQIIFHAYGKIILKDQHLIWYSQKYFKLQMNLVFISASNIAALPWGKPF